MIKQILIIFILVVYNLTIQAQVVLNFEDPCGYVTTNPSKYNKNITEYSVNSVSSDYEEMIILKYHQSDKTYTTTQMTSMPGQNAVTTKSYTTQPMIFSIELDFKNIEIPQDDYIIEILFNNGKKIKKKISYKKSEQLKRFNRTKIKVTLRKQTLKLFRNSTIKEIRINGVTREIDPEQARKIQMGAECMSTQNIFNTTRKPRVKKQNNTSAQ